MFTMVQVDHNVVHRANYEHITYRWIADKESLSCLDAKSELQIVKLQRSFKIFAFKVCFRTTNKLPLFYKSPILFGYCAMFFTSFDCFAMTLIKKNLKL